MLVTCRAAAATIVLLLAPACAGCRAMSANWLDGMKRTYQQAVEGIRADAAVMDSGNDGLEAFGAEDARYMRAARADMSR